MRTADRRSREVWASYAEYSAYGESEEASRKISGLRSTHVISFTIWCTATNWTTIPASMIRGYWNILRVELPSDCSNDSPDTPFSVLHGKTCITPHIKRLQWRRAPIRTAKPQGLVFSRDSTGIFLLSKFRNSGPTWSRVSQYQTGWSWLTVLCRNRTYVFNRHRSPFCGG